MVTRQELADVADELAETAKRLGWQHKGTRRSVGGTIYVELARRSGKSLEWLIVRVGDHKKSRERWLTTISWSPYELDERMVTEELGKPFGKVGDLFDL